MIIECINCNKKFDINSDLIPTNGRKIQCGSCNHVWFFKKKEIKTSDERIQKNKQSPLKSKENNKKNFENKTKIQNIENIKKSQIIKYEPNSSFPFSNLLSYILVAIITFIGLIIILDTFKSPIYNYFPNLEFLMFSLFETLKDISLFVKDLI